VGEDGRRCEGSGGVRLGVVVMGSVRVDLGSVREAFSGAGASDGR
jgi:hypothetical protein